jgi:glycosyltransferase involved in cell wall biosynthesis
LRILYAIQSFKELTGAEMYVYELAREMRARGHEVRITSPNFGGEIMTQASKAGILFSWLDASLHLHSYDIVHTQEPRPTAFVLNNVEAGRFVCTVHSQWPCESVINDSRISHYVCIRKDIRDKIIEIDKIPAEKTSVIHNGIDFSRFNLDYQDETRAIDPTRKKRILFTGTLDSLRINTLLHLLERSKREGFDFWICGKNHLQGASRALFNRFLITAKYILPIWNIEKLIQEADETAGIMLGRSTIEGWACGKKGWIYDVDLSGDIRSFALHDVPEDMSQFNIKIVADKIYSVYTGERTCS